MKREARLQSAKLWLKDFKGKNVIKSYSKWYAVDVVCAMKELELLGLHFTEKQKMAIQKGQYDRVRQRQLMKSRKWQKERERKEYWAGSDEGFAFIAGYTEGGAPFGLTYLEMEEIESKGREWEKIKSLTDPGLKWVELKCEDDRIYWEEDAEEILCCFEKEK